MATAAPLELRTESEFVTFDGRVLEVFYLRATSEPWSRRFHVAQIGGVRSFDRKGTPALAVSVGTGMFTIHASADQASEVERLAAAIESARG